jgi:hypothetical protein
LVDGFSQVIFSFAYGDQASWASGADGFGDSLQRVTFTGSATNASQWLAAPPTPGAASPFLDRDGDGLPDSWESAYGLGPDDNSGDNGGRGDPDHDGRTNLEEYLSGSDPTNALSVLKFEGIAKGPASLPNGAAVSLLFRAASNRTYTIQFVPSLDQTTWSNLIHIPARPTNHLENVSDSAVHGSRFYRVVTPRVP